jgi:hypothetical protein
MCNRCIELEEKITHLRRFTGHQFDDLTEERILCLIADLERSKSALHPSGDQERLT